MAKACSINVWARLNGLVYDVNRNNVRFLYRVLFLTHVESYFEVVKIQINTKIMLDYT